MYNKRIRIFVILIVFLLLVCLLRLVQMQLRPDSSIQDEITGLKLQQGLSKQLKTVRGKILDRKGKILAADELQFQLCINYRLGSFADERVRRAKLQRAARQHNANSALDGVQKEIEAAVEDLRDVIDKCARFGLEKADVDSRIREMNERTWNLRSFLAWRRNGPSADILEKYNHKIESVPLSEAMEDFKGKFPDEDQQLLLIGRVNDIAEMDKDWPLLELETDDDIFTAQMEFMNIDGVRILPKAHRTYYYGRAAAQTIGWVGPATQQQDKELFRDDRLSSYLDDEVCGREDGAEYVCETILRGRRGEVVYDIDRQLVKRTETRFGGDVSLTLDIELQKKIEGYLVNCALNANCRVPMAVVVIDVASSDILALVSVPNFDLNRARYDYGRLVSDPNEPLRNRAINKQYPPGSVVKPLILIAGLESGRITADEVISCPDRSVPVGWPDCWIYNRYKIGHDDGWQGQGGNNARNAVKGSCNIYFSRLADRIEPLILQRWLFDFGYGREILCPPAEAADAEHSRKIRQAQGQISNVPPIDMILHFEQVPSLEAAERRYFGIGQGSLRVSPLQVANSFAAIARGGVYKPPRLFIDDSNEPGFSSTALKISPQTLRTVRDGMSAVVNEPGGTAYREFAPAGLAGQGIKVYGKTGSTERPDNAWFAGFAEDGTGRSIAIAVVVEGGQRGSSDAAPLARDIIQFCVEAGYIGPVRSAEE